MPIPSFATPTHRKDLQVPMNMTTTVPNPLQPVHAPCQRRGDRSRFSPRAIAAMLATATGLALGGSAIAIAPSLAAETATPSLLPSRVNFTPPPDAPRPATSTGTASRGDSPTRSRSIVPKDNQWGLTLAERPTFLAYVAEVDPSGTASFAITAEGTEETVCTARLSDLAPNRFLRIESCAELAVGQTYRWTLSLPQPTGDTATERVTLVGRVQVADSTTVEGPGPEVTGIDRVVQYGKSGLWYEAVNELASLWETSPQSLQVMSDWASLLAVAGLELDPVTLTSATIATR